MQTGELVPSELIYRLAFRAVIDGIKNYGGVVLDGAVRTLDQAEKYQDFFVKNNWSNEVGAISIELSDEQAIERLSKRLICSQCGEIFIDGGLKKCAKCGGKLSVRPDDDPEAVRTRLSVQGNAALAPILQFYNKLGILKIVDGNDSIENVQKEIIKVLT